MTIRRKRRSGTEALEAALKEKRIAREREARRKAEAEAAA
jgi:hypothetical protein